jgi:dTDP-4-dehydrorhamnose 3,5-epimerase-like enzyme
LISIKKDSMKTCLLQIALWNEKEPDQEMEDQESGVNEEGMMTSIRFENDVTEIRRIPVKGTGRDERGWVMNPLELAGLTGKPLAALHVASMRPGAVRGNHVHGNAVEWVVFCGGPVRIFAGEPGSPGYEEIVVFGVEAELFGIPAGKAHAFRNDSESEIYLVVFYDRVPEQVLAAII